MTKGLLLFYLVLMSWIPSSAQVYLIDGDSLHCFTSDEVRKLMVMSIDLQQQSELLINCQKSNEYYGKLIEGTQGIINDMKQSALIQDQINQTHISQIAILNKSLKRERANKSLWKGTTAVAVLVIIYSIIPK